MPRYTDKQIEDALFTCKGMVYVAAKQLGCSPNTIRARLAKSKALQQVIETARGLTVDTAELKLFEAIQEGEAWAIQFYLKTQGKRRGYNERSDADGIIAEILAEIARVGFGAIVEGSGSSQADTDAGFVN